MTRYSYADAAVDAALAIAASWGGPYRNPRWIRDLLAVHEAEVTGRRQWIEGVKRRLGLITPEDDAAARVRQWEHDHLTADDLAVALCAGARVLDAALTLELADQRVPEVPACPYPSPNLAWQYWPPISADYLSSGYLWGRT